MRKRQFIIRDLDEYTGDVQMAFIPEPDDEEDVLEESMVSKKNELGQDEMMIEIEIMAF